MRVLREPALLAQPRQCGGASLSRRIALLLLVSAASTSLLMLDDRLQQLVTPHNLAVFKPGWCAALMLIVACLWLSGSRIVANAVIALFAGMQLLQLCHIAAIGRPLSPLDIAMIPHQSRDIGEAVRAEIGQNWPSLLAGGVPYALLFALFNLGLPRVPLPRLRWAWLAVALALAFVPYSAARRNITHYMPQAKRSSLHNSLMAFGYYAANLSGSSVRSDIDPYRPYVVARAAGNDAARPRSIWLVIFDSTRADHWGVAGYARDTTPVMSRWVAQGDARWHRGVAGAAATRAAMALLLNGVREPGHLEQLRSHRGNLFRLAKQAGYRTYWLSTQYGGDLLEDQDKTSIEVTRTRETDPERVAAVGDDAIIDMLAPLKPGEPRLIVLLLRTAHIPYEDAYRRRATPPPPWPDTASSSSAQRKIDAYDHAIAYQDDLVGRLYQRFEALDEQGLFVVTSDHGQMLGEDGVWGHNVLTPQIAQVPMLVRSRGPAQAPLGENGEWIFHNQLAFALTARMGYRIDNPNARAGRYFLQGPDAFGDILFREARVADGQLVLGELSGLRPASSR